MGVSFALASTPTTITKDTLVLDSGASSHTFNNHSWFNSLKILNQPKSFASANGGDVIISHTGTVTLDMVSPMGQHCEVLLGAMYSPNMPCNLISTGLL